MSDVTISLSNIQSIKTVHIEGLGTFKVRRLGSGEEYDLSMKRGKLNKLAKELLAIKKQADKMDSDKAEKFAEQHLSEIDKMTKEIADVHKFELDLYKKCFVDDNGGKNSDKLINSLTPDERKKLYDTIFKDNDE